MSGRTRADDRHPTHAVQQQAVYQSIGGLDSACLSTYLHPAAKKKAVTAEDLWVRRIHWATGGAGETEEAVRSI